tara:strand:+ start:106 stop:384 length:279 start_codon:yes stop_codon:yes gene_type:complete
LGYPISHTPKFVKRKKTILDKRTDLIFILPNRYPIPLININEKYTNRLIKEIPKIKSETNKHIIGIEIPIYLFLKLIIENNATAVTGVKFGG